MAKTESNLMQELGPKKWKKKVEDANAFYDRYKAGKRDPKTGEYYHKIDFENPVKTTKVGNYEASLPCHACGEPLTVRTSTVCVICGNCKKFNRILRNEDGSIEAAPRE